MSEIVWNNVKKKSNRRTRIHSRSGLPQSYDKKTYTIHFFQSSTEEGSAHRKLASINTAVR